MTHINQCEGIAKHEEKVELAEKNMPEDIKISDLSDLFKVFGDGTRLKILSALCVTELCVFDLSCLLSVSLSAVSHQLRFLKNAKLITSRKAGKNVYYSLKDEHVRAIIDIGMAHINE